MLKLSEKKLARREKFRKLGEAISKIRQIGDPDVSDYTTGRSSSFEFKRSDKHNREGQDVEGRGTEIPFGPAFKTPQWERTVRK